MLNSDPSELARLSALDFAAVVPSILPSIDWRQSNVHWSTLSFLLSMRYWLLPPTEAAELKFPLVRRVIGSLPKECIEPYHDALVHLTKDPTEALPGTIGTISARSTEIVEFLNATQALDLLVHTADEMRRFVPGLLGWLQDQNWPPFRDCWFQLERFPELVVDPIREELRKGDDGEWEASLMRFLRDVVPPERREEAREEVERIVQRPTQNEIDSAVDEYANECLQAMDDWLERRKRLRGIS
ncbi:hypothetical protein B0H14DRAFT_3488695 [Mycena olivaceomarginata]|nr:hypothetical protein B0H14DRAFT_3488695 [Mycena olivaceomarginata]